MHLCVCQVQSSLFAGGGAGGHSLEVFVRVWNASVVFKER